LTRLTDNNCSEGQGRRREARELKAVRSKDTTVGTQTEYEAAMRAISVRESAKSNRQQKTHRVDSDGTSRKLMHLTRGGLSRESGRGVSRSHSSEERLRKQREQRAEEPKKVVNEPTIKPSAGSPVKPLRSGPTGQLPAEGATSKRGGATTLLKRAEASRWNDEEASGRR